MSSSPYIYPLTGRTVSRVEREDRQGHRAHVAWLTGLSGAGKSTVAIAVERRLFAAGLSVKILDGDDVRSGLCSDLGFSPDDRRENIRRVAAAARLFADTGYLVICSFVSPTQSMRAFAKTIVGEPDFSEVHVAADLATCEARDTKGLYAKARSGEIQGFTGVDSPYEAPVDAALTLDTGTESLASCADELADYLLAKIERKTSV